MNLLRLLKSLIVMVSIGLVAASCGGDSNAAPTGSAEEFKEIVERSLSVDFDPLETPKDALGRADLVVTGVVADVAKGMEVTVPNYGEICRDGETPPPPIEGPDEEPGCIPGEELVMFSYLSVTVDVDKTLAGDLPGELVVQVEVPHVDFERSRELFPLRGRLLLILADETDWQFTAESQRRWSDEPKGETVWIPYPDGLILEGTEGSFVTVYDHGNLVERWGLRSERFEDLVAAFDS
jgi:hypothetical protein